MRSLAFPRVVGVLLAAPLLVLGCKTDPTQLVVVVDTDYRVPAELALVRVIALDAKGAETSRRDFPLDAGSDVPFSLAIVPRGQDASRRTTVVVQGFASASDAEPMVTRRAVTGFRENKTLRLDMFLAARCATLTCTVGDTCTQDGCVNETVEPTTLEEVRPGQEFRERPDSGPTPDGGTDGATDVCRTSPDRDGDGDRSIACGGGDCDDDDPDRSSRKEEVCDADDVDEDCDPTTVGNTDADGDTFASSACCNVRSDGTRLCGDDCDDTDPLRSPRATERCNGIDDDCDGTEDGAAAAVACTMMLGSASGMAACTAGACEIASCPTGLEDCDGMFEGGCETDLATTAAHCGSCMNACGAGDLCASSRCDRIVSVASGANHICWVYGSGAAACRGSTNALGQLGDGTTMMRSSPVSVMGLTDAVQISAGDDHTCAVRMGGQVVCWGKNDHGQLGNGAASASSAMPVAVMGLTDAAQVSAGTGHTCAVRRGGQIVCWGDNGSGQLGDGSTTAQQTAPVAVMTTNTDYAFVSAGGFHTCARRMGGQVECWGLNDVGQVGTGSIDGMRYRSPQPVAGLTAALLSAGARHTCARPMSTSGIRCWGDNSSRQLGDDTTTNQGAPTPVALGTGVTALDAVSLSAGNEHTCIADRSGRVACWGNNSSRQLGTASTAASVGHAELVTDITDGRLVSAGQGSTCAVLTSGGFSCWGGGMPTAVPVANLP